MKFVAVLMLVKAVFLFHNLCDSRETPLFLLGNQGVIMMYIDAVKC